jgi:dihydropteroate synthase
MRQVMPASLRVGGEVLALGERPLVMGIVNVTPDSFSDGGHYFDANAAVQHALRLVEDGADWLDIGGESTRPGAEPVSLDEELRRVLPVVEKLAGLVKTPISIDTYKPEVARRAVQAGARAVNDVTGFRDPKMVEVAASCDAACICMHMRGTPATMRELAQYDDVVRETVEYLQERVESLASEGIDRERLVVDPGVGFAKKLPHNIEILRRLAEYHAISRPVLLGASRKRIIGDLTGRPEEARMAGTLATAVLACLKGVHFLRVHDVKEVVDALTVTCAIEKEEPPTDPVETAARTGR